MTKFLVLFAAVILGASAFPNTYFEERIVGGQDAEEGRFTYQVSLRSTTDFHFCGASIVDATTILTAAHCISGKRPQDIIVVAGSQKLNQGGKTHEVSFIKVHASGDIGILILKDPLQFSAHVSAIELETERVSSNEDCVVSGWGSTSASGSAPNHLQYVNLKTLDHVDCRAQGGSANNKEVCTYTKPGEGTCFGDSGSPLVLSANNKQIGIVSRGRPCAIGYPDIYTEVAPFVDWINENKV